MIESVDTRQTTTSCLPARDIRMRCATLPRQSRLRHERHSRPHCPRPQGARLVVKKTLRSMTSMTAAATDAVTTAAAEGTQTYPTPAAREALYSTAAEQPTEQQLEVSGKLPEWLDGQLLVNGGGDYSASVHMFDGFGSVSKVRLQGGKAWGSQRFLDTKAYRAYKAAGKLQYREFAAAVPADGPLDQIKLVLSDIVSLVTQSPNFTDNASVNLHQVGPGGSQVLATSETPSAAYLVDPATLATVKKVEYSDDVKGDLTTAHPFVMPDGSLVNFTRTLPFGGFNLFRQDPVTLKRTKIAYVPDRRPLTPAWLHDFACTDKYAVLVEWPLYMNLGSLVFNLPADYVFMNWAPQDGTLVHLVTLDGSQPVRTFKCPTFFAFHFGNAFESADGRELHVDVAAYDDPTILNDLLLQPLRTAPPGHQVSPSSYRRLTIPLTSNSSSSSPQELQAPQPLVTDGSPHQQFCEFPAVNPTHAGKPYRYCWCLCAVRPTNMGNAIAKIDTQQGTAVTWHKPGGAPGEPRFVPRPGATEEDDGVVLAPGMGPDGLSLLAVLDGKSLQELAVVQMPWAVPNRFHGLWLGGASA